jgi:hypothetical protein
MAFFGLFKSRVEREADKRAEDAKLARAYDLGRRTSDTVIKLIDAFFDEKVVPVARNVNSAFERQMEGYHHDGYTQDAMAMFVDYSAKLKDLKQNAVDGTWDSLGEWKYLLIKEGTKADFDRYIAHKYDPVWKELDDNASAQMAYCAARISGHITDEMHAMTPDELKEYMARTKRVNP